MEVFPLKIFVIIVGGGGWGAVAFVIAFALGLGFIVDNIVASTLVMGGIATAICLIRAIYVWIKSTNFWATLANFFINLFLFAVVFAVFFIGVVIEPMTMGTIIALMFTAHIVVVVAMFGCKHISPLVPLSTLLYIVFVAEIMMYAPAFPTHFYNDIDSWFVSLLMSIILPLKFAVPLAFSFYGYGDDDLGDIDYHEGKAWIRVLISFIVVVLITVGGFLGAYFINKPSTIHEETYFQNANIRHFREGGNYYIEFGRFTINNATDQDFIRWRIVTTHDNKKLLVTDQIITHRQTHYANTAGIEWVDTDVRDWLVNDFYTSAFGGVGGIIAPNFTGSTVGADITCQVFFLTNAEVNQLNNTSNFPAVNGITPFAYSTSTHLAETNRTRHLTRSVFTLSAQRVVGMINANGTSQGQAQLVATIGVRPSIWIDTSVLFV